MVSHFQNDVNEMVQNKSRIKSCMKPYIRSIPSTMGVESEVEVMDNAQERLCHWLHVLCTPESCNGYPYPWVPNTHPYIPMGKWVGNGYGLGRMGG
jgi:hypothetical protein